MSEIKQSKTHEIIEDFAKEINRKKFSVGNPSTHIINFRDDRVAKNARGIFKVPIGLLLFRKNNGRIASDVLDYEKTHGYLDEKSEEGQKKLCSFLENKDPEKKDILREDIAHGGQQDPAIITCDGFLINGNRRKMVMEQLKQMRPADERFKYMKVVILPGPKDEGGSPALLEIERLENRYQLQNEGKSEYYGLDRALSIKRKVDAGLSLKDQVMDNPSHANKDDKGIRKAVKEIEKEYLKPLECVDRYLAQFKQSGKYHAISTGRGDREGRWQAFVDYSNTYETKFSNSSYLIQNNIEQEEIGDIQAAAFDIIRLRHIPGMPKVHSIMRDIHKYCSKSDGKEAICKISQKVDSEWPATDDEWATKHKKNIIYHLKQADKAYNQEKERETPIGLLDAALKKLNHKDMDLNNIETNDYKKARNLSVAIQKRSKDLEGQIYKLSKRQK